MSEGRREMSIDEEFRAFDQEVLVEQIRLTRDLDPSTLLASFLEFDEEAAEIERQWFRYHRLVNDERREQALERQADACNGS